MLHRHPTWYCCSGTWERKGRPNTAQEHCLSLEQMTLLWVQTQTGCDCPSGRGLVFTSGVESHGFSARSYLSSGHIHLSAPLQCLDVGQPQRMVDCSTSDGHPYGLLPSHLCPLPSDSGDAELGGHPALRVRPSRAGQCAGTQLFR